MTAIPVSRARILLIISGGIAAYKSLELIRRLTDRGATVRVVMTAAAREFISPLSAATLSGQPIRDDLFSLTDEAAIGHIELSRAADLVVIAPASANILARMAAGLADDLATTLLLATDKRVLAAPAMNVRMWLNRGRWPAGNSARAAWLNRRRLSRRSNRRWSGERRSANRPNRPRLIRVRSAAGILLSPPGRLMSRSTRSGSSETDLRGGRDMQLRNRRLAPAQG
jgi:hypothetical protein